MEFFFGFFLGVLVTGVIWRATEKG